MTSRLKGSSSSMFARRTILSSLNLQVSLSLSFLFLVSVGMSRFSFCMLTHRNFGFDFCSLFWANALGFECLLRDIKLIGVSFFCIYIYIYIFWDEFRDFDL